MADKFGMSVRQAAELDHAFVRNDWYPSDVKKLCKGDVLAQVLDVLYGRAKIEPIEHIVNFDSEALVPAGFSVARDNYQFPLRLSGNFRWSDIGLMGLIEQASTKAGNWIPGRRALTAQLLDYMLDHPYLIPAELEGRRIFFWGTIYHDKDGFRCIRTLSWNGSEPQEELFYIGLLQVHRAPGMIGM